MSNDYENSVMKLIDLILQCRPEDPYEFSSIFFIDEQNINYKLSHSLHSLYYLYKNLILFRNISCYIFCLDNNNNEINNLQILQQNNYEQNGITMIGGNINGSISGSGNGNGSTSSNLDTELMSLNNFQKIMTSLYGLEKHSIYLLFNDILISSYSNSSIISFTFPEFEYHLMSIILSIKFYDFLFQIIEEFQTPNSSLITINTITTTESQLNNKPIDEFITYYKLLKPSPCQSLFYPSTTSSNSNSNSASMRNIYDFSMIKGLELFKQTHSLTTNPWNLIYIGNCIQIFLIERNNQMRNIIHGSNK